MANVTSKNPFLSSVSANRRAEKFSGAVLTVAVTWWKYSLWKEV